MRRNVALVLILLFAASAQGRQGGYYNRTRPAPNNGREASPPEDRPQVDPYRHSTGRREAPPAPAPTPRRNYYPSIRSGQGPNANVRHHCVPSRGSMVVRR